MLSLKIHNRFSISIPRIQRKHPVREVWAVSSVYARGLAILGALFFASIILGLQPEWRADNGVALGYAPMVLPTPESFAIARAAVPNARTTRAPHEVQLVAPPARTDSLFDALMIPLANQARQRRADTARRDPEFSKRIDGALNEGRVNFLLFGYGETHEPPLTERALIGSHTIISYDTRTRRADIVSLTHDIRAPEIERELTKRGEKPTAQRIDRAYFVGGFQLQRKMIENATGLAIDYQIVFRDAAMQRLVDEVFEGVQVTAPMAFDAHPFYLDGVKYPRGHFPQGPQTLNGRQTIQFIKTVQVAEGLYDKVLEHNARKSLVFDALLRALREKYDDGAFWLKGAAFIAREWFSGAIVCDFDPLALIVNNIGSATAHLPRTRGTASLPTIQRSLYIVDPAHGDGGVQWVNANAAVNPITQRDIDAGMYPTFAMAVPLNANPYGDLVTGYWTLVRALVKESLLERRSVPLDTPLREEE